MPKPGLFNAEASLAKSTVRQISVILHQVFDLAVEDEFMKRNPIDSKRLFISSDREEKRRALEEFELKGIIRGIPSLKQEDGLLLALLIFTGMRRGEVIALRWEDLEMQLSVMTPIVYNGLLWYYV